MPPGRCGFLERRHLTSPRCNCYQRMTIVLGVTWVLLLGERNATANLLGHLATLPAGRRNYRAGPVKSDRIIRYSRDEKDGFL